MKTAIIIFLVGFGLSQVVLNHIMRDRVSALESAVHSHMVEIQALKDAGKTAEREAYYLGSNVDLREATESIYRAKTNAHMSLKNFSDAIDAHAP